MGKAGLLVLAMALVAATAFAEIDAPNVVQISSNHHSFNVAVINTFAESQSVRISFLSPFAYTISPSFSNIRGNSMTVYSIDLKPSPEFSQQSYIAKLVAKIGDTRFEKEIELQVGTIPTISLSETESKPSGFAILPDFNFSTLSLFPTLPTLPSFPIEIFHDELGPIELLVDVILVLCIAILAVALVARTTHRKRERKT